MHLFTEDHIGLNIKDLKERFAEANECLIRHDTFARFEYAWLVRGNLGFQLYVGNLAVGENGMYMDDVQQEVFRDYRDSQVTVNKMMEEGWYNVDEKGFMEAAQVHYEHAMGW